MLFSEDVEKLIEILQKEPIKYLAIIMLALDSGCRRGELTGLTWNDVDFEKSIININKATQYVSGLVLLKRLLNRIVVIELYTLPYHYSSIKEI